MARRKKGTKAKNTSKRRPKKNKGPPKKKAKKRRAPARKAPRGKSPERADTRRGGGTVADGRKAEAAALVSVDLEKLAGSPDLVRATIEGTSRVVLAPGETKGSIKDVAVGSFVTLWIDVTGNPGQTATIKVSRATPTPVSVAIPGHTGQTALSQSLLVTG